MDTCWAEHVRAEMGSLGGDQAPKPFLPPLPKGAACTQVRCLFGQIRPRTVGGGGAASCTDPSLDGVGAPPPARGLLVHPTLGEVPVHLPDGGHGPHLPDLSSPPDHTKAGSL